MKQGKKISSSMEDYLEAIVILKKRNRIARVKDISSLLHVKTSSVSAALDNLSRNGFVIHERYGYVDLTQEGKRLADNCKNKHELLSKFLENILGVNPKIAAEDACKLEHSISPETFKKLSKFIEFVEKAPYSGRPDWLKGFDYYFKTGKRLRCKVKELRQKSKK